MRSRVRNPWWLITTVIGISLLGWFLNTFSPENLLLITVFFALIAVIIGSLSFFLLNNVRRSLLITVGLITILLLRYVNLREPYYVVLLILILLSLELFRPNR